MRTRVSPLAGLPASHVDEYYAIQTLVRELSYAGNEAARRYLAALDKGLLKIVSKMGISTLRSYHGAQLMEIVGLADELVAAHFTGTSSHLGGAGLDEIAGEVLSRHRQAFSSAPRALAARASGPPRAEVAMAWSPISAPASGKAIHTQREPRGRLATAVVA